MTNVLYHRFDTSGIAVRDRFEYWRDWCSQAVDLPLQLEPLHRRPYDFTASAEALGIGDVDFVEYRSGAVYGRWTREATAAADRLRLMILAPTPDASGFCHDDQYSLDPGAAVLVGATDGGWQVPQGLHGIQVNVPRQALQVSDAQLAGFNDQRRLRRDPTFTGLIRPALVGLSGHLDALSRTDLPELGALWISLLRMLTRSLAGTDTAGTDTKLARWLQIQRHIRANLADPRLSPGTIADALYISRSTLYTAAPADSDGVAGEIRRQRLARAHTLLRDPTTTLTIAQIAASVGLPNAGRFSRAFRDRYGLTPRELRADHRASDRYGRHAAPADERGTEDG